MTSSPHLRETLQQLGWRITLVQDGWWRCLIEEDGASWSGESATEQGAIEAAFARMVPSVLARRALIEGWSESSAARTPEPELEKVDAPTEEVKQTEDPRPAESGLGAEETTETAPPPQAIVEGPAHPAPPRLELADALDALAQQKTELHEACAELGELAPSRIRLVLLLWVARMRAVEQACPGESAVQAAGHEIANLLQEQAFTLWPGQVPALQLSARPRDCRRMVASNGEGPDLHHWSEVADAASAALSQLDAEPGRDAEGWADTQALTPRPNDPNCVLIEIRRRLDRLASLWPPEDKRLVPSSQDLRDDTLRAALLDIAQRARWLRGGVSDAQTWSSLFGYLRRIADHCRYDFPELSRLLNEEYRPPARTWAKQLGQDPEAKQRKRTRRALLQSRPDAAVAPAALRTWLLEAFEIFTNPDLAALLRRLTDRVAAIESDDMPDRRRRQRLTKLKSLMGETLDDARQLAIEAEANAANPAADDAAAAANTPDPIEELRERVLPVTRGKRLLFVSNRPDPHLEADIQTALEPAELDWCVAENKRVDSAAEAIGRGSYDLVLCATGFLDHGTDKILRTACRNAGRVAYFRVYKGRTLACLRAIERDLGLHHEAALSLGR